MPSRTQRGNETQNAVAAYFRDHGWPYADSTGAGRAGIDVTNLPGLLCEVKGRRDLNLPAWLRQAASHGAGVPLVVHRPDGFGVKSVDLWPVTFHLRDAVTLLRDAGYGSSRPDPLLPCRHDDGASWAG
jgi:hypothetical protein